jgi:hypothetical protein
MRQLPFFMHRIAAAALRSQSDQRLGARRRNAADADNAMGIGKVQSIGEETARDARGNQQTHAMTHLDSPYSHPTPPSPSTASRALPSLRGSRPCRPARLLAHRPPPGPGPEVGHRTAHVSLRRDQSAKLGLDRQRVNWAGRGCVTKGFPCIGAGELLLGAPAVAENGRKLV